MKKLLLIAVAAIITTVGYCQQNTTNVFDNALYARVGLGFPGGELRDNEVITAAGQFEVGTIFYINSLKTGDKFRLGLDVTYLSFTGMAHLGQLRDDNKTDSYFTAGLKAGPCASVNIVGNLMADAYFKLYPNAFIVGETENNNYEADTQFKLGTSFGFNLRYKAIMLGMEFTSAKYDFNNISVSRLALESSTKSIKLPVTFVSLGVKL